MAKRLSGTALFTHLSPVDESAGNPEAIPLVTMMRLPRPYRNRDSRVCRVTRLALGGSVASFIQDLRYALRMLLKSPGFTVVAVLTLAVGIGANVAIFSVVYAVVLRPLPFPHPEQLVRVFDDLRGSNDQDVGMSAPELWDLQDRSGVFQEHLGGGAQ